MRCYRDLIVCLSFLIHLLRIEYSPRPQSDYTNPFRPYLSALRNAQYPFSVYVHRQANCKMYSNRVRWLVDSEL
jgi:hypothetical protein